MDIISPPLCFFFFALVCFVLCCFIVYCFGEKNYGMQSQTFRTGALLEATKKQDGDVLWVNELVT